MNKFAIIAIILLFALCLSGCQSDTDFRLPAVGQVIYCPSCRLDLYQRVAGTSRTAYRRLDYAQLRWDIAPPLPGAEHICPLCGADIVIWGDPIANSESRHIARVYYRDRASEPECYYAY